MRHAYLMSCFLSGSRYQKRKQTGKIKKTEELTTKQHEKKRQVAGNSKRYYRRKKQLKAVLDTTPSSEEDDSLQFIQDQMKFKKIFKSCTKRTAILVSAGTCPSKKKKSNLQFCQINLF